MKKIKAKLVLIVGNNEGRLIKDCFDNDFEKFKDFCMKLGFFDVKKDEYLEIEGIHFYLTHRPYNHKKTM